MNTRIALSLSLAVFGACATDDADINTDTESAQVAPGRSATIHQPLYDQLGKPECGNGTVASPIAQEIELRWLATACSGPNELSLEIGGVEVLKTVAGSGCTCMPGVHSVRITDPTVLKMIDGTVDFRVSAPGATLMAWAEVAILDQRGVHEFTVFNAGGGPTEGDEGENLCAAGSMENGTGWIEVQMGEQCDDGNLVDGDGCSATCQKE
jgi:cysteine-rich repeat protein